MKRRTKAVAVMMLALAMVMELLLGPFMAALAAGGTQSVSYVDAKGKAMGSADCQSVAQTMETGWYVAQNEVFDERIEVTGDVNLILADGGTLKANDGIHLQENSSLTLWAQSTGKTMGALEARCADRESWKAAIGGNAERDAEGKFIDYTGYITINGGKILADGGPRKFLEWGWGGAGICGQSVTINGGNVTAWGKGYGEGMISGAGIAGDEITINGGTVEAKGRSASAETSLTAAAKAAA